MGGIYMSKKRMLDLAINKLGLEFGDLDLTFHKMDKGKPGDVTSY